MSPDPLPFDALQWRVSAAMGKPDSHAFSQLRMRPDQGCVTLVSVRSFLLHTSGCSWLLRLGFFPPFFRRWGGTSPPCHGSRRTRWTEQRGGSPRRRRRRRRTRRRPGPASGGGLGTPWRSAVASRRGKDSQGSRRRRRPTTTMTMMTRRRTTWPPVSASVPAWGVARSRRASPRAGRRRQSPELGRPGPGPRHEGDLKGHLTLRLEGLRWLRRARSGRLLPRGRRSYRQRMGVTLKSSRPCPGNLLPGRPKQGGAEVAGEADLGGRFGSRDPRNLPPGAVDHGSKWVSISGCLRLGFPFICLGRDFPFLFYSASEAMARPTWHPGRPLRRRRSVRPAPPRTLSFGRPFRRAFHRRGLGRRLSLGNRFPRLALLPRRPS
jgi:hypothetical protein